MTVKPLIAAIAAGLTVAMVPAPASAGDNGTNLGVDVRLRLDNDYRHRGYRSHGYRHRDYRHGGLVVLFDNYRDGWYYPRYRGGRVRTETVVTDAGFIRLLYLRGGRVIDSEIIGRVDRDYRRGRGHGYGRYDRWDDYGRYGRYDGRYGRRHDDRYGRYHDGRHDGNRDWYDDRYDRRDDRRDRRDDRYDDRDDRRDGRHIPYMDNSETVRPAENNPFGIEGRVVRTPGNLTDYTPRARGVEAKAPAPRRSGIKGEVVGHSSDLDDRLEGGN